MVKTTVEVVNRKVQLVCPPGSSKTIQEFKEDVDINNIIKKFSKGGVSFGNFRNPGSNMDCSSAVDYKAAMGIVNKGRQQFESLPSKVRREFDNSPAEFLAFMADPKNIDEAIRLGIVTKHVEPAPAAPMKVEVVNPTPASSDSLPPKK